MGEASVDVTLTDPIFIKMEGLSYSEIEKSKMKIDPEYDSFYTNFFLKKGTNLSHRHLIRSAVISLNSSVHDPFKIYDKAIKVKFRSFTFIRISLIIND